MIAVRDVGAPRPFRLLCATTFLVFASVTGVSAQGPVTDTTTPVIKAADAEVGQVQILVGRSTVLNVGVPIMRVSLTRPEIADAVATSQQQLLIHGKAAGAITMFVWDRSGGIKRYEVTVTRDLGEVNAQMQQLFPGEPIKVTGNGKDLVLSGTVSSKYVIEKAADVASGYVEKKENVVNLLRQADGAQSNQVLLRVRFAEVSRSAMTELGVSFFTSALGFKNYVGRTTTGQFPAPTFDSQGGDPKLVFSDLLNLFLFNNKEGLGTVIRAMQNKGLFQSLAEPNLVAESGKEASFLAGGEYPYPAVQGNGAAMAVTIVFKEFGIRLTFTPTIVGTDTVHLKVRPEVSSLDFTNAISYQGFRVPTLSTRRAETEIELQNGQTFAIAGLMNNTITSTMQKIPGIGDIPILGLLFRSKAAQKNQTELVVMVTPQIIPRNSMGAAERLPGQAEPYLPLAPKVIPPPPPYLGPPIRQQDEPPVTVPAPAAGRAPATAPAQGPVPMTMGQAPVSQPVGQGQMLAPANGNQPPTPAPAAPSDQPRALESQAAMAAAATPPGGSPVAGSAAAEEPPPDPAPLLDAKALARERKDLRKRQEAEAAALARQQEDERQQREAEARALAKQQAEDARLEAERLKAEKIEAEQLRKQQEKLAREQAKRDAETAKRQAELDRKRAKEIQAAEERVKNAQTVLQAAQQQRKNQQQ